SRHRSFGRLARSLSFRLQGGRGRDECQGRDLPGGLRGARGRGTRAPLGTPPPERLRGRGVPARAELPPLRSAAAGALLVLVPAGGLALLLASPRLDVQWQNQPAHFWLVLASGAVTGALAFLTGEAAARRGDARVLRLSLAFVSGSGFLGLHALATPGVLLAGKNAGFQAAAAVGLLIASPLAAWSALDER